MGFESGGGELDFQAGILAIGLRLEPQGLKPRGWNLGLEVGISVSGVEFWLWG